MLTHVLWFLALVVCCGLVAKEAYDRGRSSMTEKWIAEISRAMKERDEMKADRDQRTMQLEYTREIRDNWVTAAKSWEARYEKEKAEYARFVDSVIHRIRGGATLGVADDEPIEDPPTVAQADRMAFEDMRNREQLRLEEDDAAPLIRVDADEEEEDDGN